MAESRHRYLYERLGDHDFQQLVNALLAAQFPNFTPMALRQADGGIDGQRKLDPSTVLIYQVKWSVSGSEKNPVSWLDATVRKELDNLRRLAKEGVRHYVLVTNVPSTAKPGTGTFAALNKKLDAYAKELGFDELSCIWREALNSWLDNSDDSIKWAYADMLAGWDLIRFLVAEHVGATKNQADRKLIRQVAASQWDDDQRVKFSQVEVDRKRMVDLFVDVTAELVHSPRKVRAQDLSSMDLGGAAHHLLHTPAPFTLVRGAPGQGKSTLSQYICQVHRSAFMPESERPETLPVLDKPRFPIRLDLSDYALWLAGNDPWDHSDTKARREKARKGITGTVECFIADLMTHASGGITASADMVQGIFERVPSLVVLDGLDEVGSASIRRRVVNEIDAFAGRGKAYTEPLKVVVTTRPSAGELPEPAPDKFEIIALNQLTGEQRADYLRKWCIVREIKAGDGRALRVSFQEKSREPYIHELAGNPMQLTILLDLLHQQGAATPTQRTDLYDTYVDLLLAREANKHPKAVKDHKEELLEIIPFLGWYLHARTEESQINGRMSVDDLKAAMRHFQRTYGNQESIVDELFIGISDRLWTLTSQVDGTYEFEVLSLREYFAARFLYRNAGEGNPDFDSTAVLRELLRRPYWLNTARFYGGNAKGSNVYVLAAGIDQELSQTSSPASYLAAWALLTDGVFQRRPREARKVLTALCSDVGIPILLSALDRRDIVALPELPHLPAEDGADPTWSRLTTLISKNPGDSANPQRVRVLRELINQRREFAKWWYEQLTAAIGTEQQNAWLAIGACCEAGTGTTADFEDMDLSDGVAELYLSTGLAPTPGGPFETALLAAVLNGECPCVTSTSSMPAQVAAALAPGEFFTSSTTGFISGDAHAKRRRSEAITQLRKAGSPWEDVAKTRGYKPGYKGSTFPWADTATAVHDHVGRCWTASEIAIIGAASPFKPAYTKRPGATAFGSTGHPAELLAQSRTNAGKASWWREKLETVDDDLGRAEWALALWCVATGAVVSELLPELTEVLAQLPGARRLTVLRAAEQVARFGWLEKRLVSRNTTDTELDALNQLRVPVPPAGPGEEAGASSPTTMPSLLSVARADQWLKVDAMATYK
ncbi:NACHT domain-containing protein [Mycolicibacterium holsaticum]|uniref:Large ATP-binding protein n=1 Tax=Mycolicibacterium holsaticum TaxID=152142 RepID=A0A1E3S0B4_9MYCO|nr:large ATP-binding protein [Mycolicibacterium holsaticum]ODQ95540.1 large ATP-binding protein [Mycolicibacterium holsaticum]